MTEKRCAYCDGRMNLLRSDAKYCSQKCGTYGRRKAARTPIPAELRERDRWVRWSLRRRGAGTAKVPVTVAGRNASTVDPSTWTTYADAAASTVGDGLGFVLNGDGLACVDLDGVLDGDTLDPRAAAMLAELAPFYVEVSPSGRGLHAWVRHGAPNGRRMFTRPDGLRVEWYTTERYLTMTGQEFEWQ